MSSLSRLHYRPAIALLITLGVIVLAACSGGGNQPSSSGGGNQPSSSGATSAALAKVSVAIPIPIAAYLLPMYAQEKGLFAKYGIDADVKVIPPPGVMSLMVAGREDFGIFSGPTVENAAIQGSDLVWISTYISEPLVSLMARPQITDIAALKGKTIAITTPGSLSEFMTRRLLRENGLDPDRDVQIRVVAGQSASRNALIAGQVDAVILGSPDDALAAQNGMKVLKDLRGGAYTWPFAGMMTRKSYAEANPEVTTNFLRAMNEAVDSWRSDPEGVQELIIRTSKVDAATAKQAYDEVSAAFNSSNIPDAKASAVALDELKTRDPKAANVRPEDVVLPTYAQQAGR